MQMNLQLDAEFHEQVQTFLASSRDRMWIQTPQLSLYTRKGRCVWAGEWLRCLDIADLTVADHLRRRGLAKQVFAEFKQCSGYDAIRIENVVNPELEAYLSGLADAHHHWDDERKRLLWTRVVERRR